MVWDRAGCLCAAESCSTLFLSFAQQLIFVVVADVMKIQPKPCSFSEVKVVSGVSFPEDTFDIEGWLLAYFCKNTAGSSNAGCHQGPARWRLLSQSLGGWWITGQQNVSIVLSFMAFYLSTWKDMTAAYVTKAQCVSIHPLVTLS